VISTPTPQPLTNVGMEMWVNAWWSSYQRQTG